MPTIIKYREVPILPIFFPYSNHTCLLGKCLINGESEKSFITQNFADTILKQYPYEYYCCDKELYEIGSSVAYNKTNFPNYQNKEVGFIKPYYKSLYSKEEREKRIKEGQGYAYWEIEHQVCKLVKTEDIKGLNGKIKSCYVMEVFFRILEERKNTATSSCIDTDLALCYVDTDYFDYYTKRKDVNLVLGKDFLEQNNWKINLKNHTIIAPHNNDRINELFGVEESFYTVYV